MGVGDKSRQFSFTVCGFSSRFQSVSGGGGSLSWQLARVPDHLLLPFTTVCRRGEDHGEGENDGDPELASSIPSL